MLFLMFVGGSPGSCAGGVKVTTLRVLSALTFSQLRGRSQVVIKKMAVSEDAVKKALVLFLIAAAIIFMAVFLLDYTEGGDMPHDQVRGQFLEIVFESVSAFGTVGLSTGLTPRLSTPGRWIIVCLMFVGRLGPLIFIAVLQRLQEPQYYRLPEEHPMIG
jgi:trk system potassium uptake protein TrkH